MKKIIIEIDEKTTNIDGRPYFNTNIHLENTNIGIEFIDLKKLAILVNREVHEQRKSLQKK